MTRARSLLLGAALLTGGLTTALTLLLGVDPSYVPTIGFGASLGVFTLGLLGRLPADEPRPIARPRSTPGRTVVSDRGPVEHHGA